ncbi:MAG: threonylcarbamoyl-AMP synthase [Candidatus Harrisonbacteria bacterium CG10_big_fil_rev_8_21_14_0_10_42_17]|uniref:L-threonylcarbamoyladenylate synthase n=1 Tax=Candidatus Harrisonbacteria bacterium CG10_big_fil_rev_8_21_14_0_10_42_17 TaxID=1974584 RepID=A0A2M6WHN6_9BACT|nr:MAG: threonylcarbamoyl-AMP synthase [Candidatus Harrisonbacteria bacterium CG10_big_fil_rev_8_21_14_0_10_42_17]
MKKEDIFKSVIAIKRGDVIAFPTDTIYGLLADATNPKAVEKVFKIKKRNRSKPFPVLVNSLTQAKKFAHITKTQETILKKHWPGPYTFILNYKSGLTKNAVSRDITVALRVPKETQIRALLSATKKPLVATSVNLAGEPGLNDASEIETYFQKKKLKPNLVVHARVPKNARPSKIFNLTGNRPEKIR